MSIAKCANATPFTSDTFKILQAPCDTLIFAKYAAHTVQVIVLLSKWRRHSTAYRFFASEPCKVTTQFSDMIPNLANIMQFADVSFALLQNIVR
jgi:hypothetical protein